MDGRRGPSGASELESRSEEFDAAVGGSPDVPVEGSGFEMVQNGMGEKSNEIRIRYSE